jgi:glycerol-3-phosphate dehydrogenase (NAD(P)+)
MNYTVFGTGRWSSFISWYLSSNGHHVVECGREGSRSYLALKNEGKNEYVTLHPNIHLTTDVEYAVNFSDYLFISISSQSLRSFIRSLPKKSGKNYVLCMKGLEEDTGKRLSEILIEEGIEPERIAVWLGPGHIQAFTSGKPNCMVIDGYDQKLIRYLADSLRSNLIRFYYGDDVIGSEVGAAAKNVMGIAAGMLEGGGYETLKGALMARGAREVARLIHLMGGNELSAYGLCHLGDYETTLFSPYSNNRLFGESYVKGLPFSKLAEGTIDIYQFLEHYFED